jgi:hypothetical protein
VDRSSLSLRITRGFVLFVGIGLLAIAVLTIVIITSLVVQGTALDSMWNAKPEARALFDNLGLWGILLLVFLGALALITGISLLQRRRWARWVTVALLGVNVVPDLVQGFAGQPEILLAAVPVALVVVYLALPIVGRVLRPRRDQREN